MTLIPSKPARPRTIAFVPNWRDGRDWQASAIAVRLVQVIAGVAVFLLPQHHHTICDLLLILGLAVAVISPARNGPGLALIGGLSSWVFSGGVDHHPPLDRVLPFALAVFVLWSATALAAIAPLDCIIRPELRRHWLRQSGLGVLASAVLIGLVYAVDAVTSGPTTAPLQFAGTLGVLAVVAVGAVLFTRMSRSEDDS